jgi:hypothetical protein
MSFTLKGRKKTNQPNESNLQEELENLLNGKAEFMILENSEEDCMQSIVNKQKDGMDSFRVEVIQNGQIYVHQGKLALSAAYGLFAAYLHRGTVDLKSGKWVSLEQEQVDPLNVIATSSTKNFVKLKGTLVVTVLIMGLLSTINPLLLYFGIEIENLDFFIPIILTILVGIYMLYLRRAFPGE